MKILFNFIISLILFIYSINYFSKSLENIYQKNIKFILEKNTKTLLKGIIFGTIITIICQSSTIITITTTSLVNSNIITFHNSLGIMMGSNLGTCITSFLVSLFNLNTNNKIFILFNPFTYIPIILLLSIYFYFKKKTNKSKVLLSFSLFMLSLRLLQSSLLPIQNLTWFKNLLIILNNPFLGFILGIILTIIIQSSSASIALIQTIASNNYLNYKIVIPIILGENIGTCFTTLISSIKLKKVALKVAVSHLLYNIIGSIIFLFIYYILYLLKINFLNKEVTSFNIAIIHTLFNLLSIIIFYPFINYFEKLINRLIK